MKNDYYFDLYKSTKYLLIFLFIYCLNINENSFIEKNIPKISIYMPIYNKSKYLMRSIRSIQCQTLSDIEIIAVNDFSTDNSLDLLKEIVKNDSRIIIINNDKNYGLLYTRAMGMLKSTGEYIMNVDPDDSLTGNNILEYLYKIAYQFKVDFISFGYYNWNRFDIKCTNFEQILKQPNLLKHAFADNNKIKDYLLWNKLVKRKLMLKSYEFFKNKIYSEKWNYAEDTIWSVLINKYAKSMICIKKLVYIYNSNKDSLMHYEYNILRIRDLLKFEETYRQILQYYLINFHGNIYSLKGK
jgi:glycosyltransferase involved in cell wall biosynthesis